MPDYIIRDNEIEVRPRPNLRGRGLEGHFGLEDLTSLLVNIDSPTGLTRFTNIDN